MYLEWALQHCTEPGLALLWGRPLFTRTDRMVHKAFFLVFQGEITQMIKYINGSARHQSIKRRGDSMCCEFVRRNGIPAAGDVCYSLNANPLLVSQQVVLT